MRNRKILKHSIANKVNNDLPSFYNLYPKGLQLKFVQEGECDKSLYIISNVTNYFLKRRSDVYIVTLDASAAFDKVNVYGLLSKLIEKGLSFDIMRELLSRYTRIVRHVLS